MNPAVFFGGGYWVCWGCGGGLSAEPSQVTLLGLLLHEPGCFGEGLGYVGVWRWA